MLTPKPAAGSHAPSLSAASLRSAFHLAAWFALVKLLLQFALTIWTTHLGYSYFRDEFYFLACGRHLAWGYVDQGPIVALQARFTTLLFGDSVFGIRVLSAVAGALTIGLGGILTWALGGERSAQALAMLGLLVVPVYIGVDGFLSISSPEPIFWMGVVLALILSQRGAAESRCWIAVGLCSGVGLLNKPSMAFFLVAVLTGLLLTPERRILRSRWFLAAVVLMLVIVAPFLTWEMRHDWPTWEFLRNGQIENKVRVLRPLPFVWSQIAQMQPVDALLWITGLAALLRGRSMRGFRWIGIAYLLFLALMYALRAKDYYLAPVYPMLFAAGGVAWERRFATPRGTAAERIFAFPIFESVILVTGLLLLPTASPVLRPGAWARYMHALHLAPDETETYKASILPQFFADRFGWEQLAAIVDRGVRALPPGQRSHACIFASNYGEAASLEFLGRHLDPNFPPVISGHNNYWLWGRRGCSGDPIIAIVHDTPEELSRKYTSVTILGQMSDPLAMSYEHHNVYLLSGRRTDAPGNWRDEKDYI